jgi:hypothetical protein
VREGAGAAAGTSTAAQTARKHKPQPKKGAAKKTAAEPKPVGRTRATTKKPYS